MKIGKNGILIARMLMFGIFYIAIHSIMLYLPLSLEVDVLGIIRGFLVAIISRGVELAFYRIVKEHILMIQEEKIKYPTIPG